MSKEASVVIVDVGRNMKVQGEDGTTRLDSAIQALEAFVQQKLLFSKSDEVGMVLLGTMETNNELFDELEDQTDGDQYAGISVLSPLDKPQVETLRGLGGKIRDVAFERDGGDCIEAILVAIDMISKRTAKKKYSKRIMVITDAGGDIDDEDLESTTKRILGHLDETEMTLDVIGVDFGEGTARAKDKTVAKRKNEKLLGDMASKVGGTLWMASEATELMTAFRGKAVKATSLFRGDLELGSAGDGLPLPLRISVHCYAKVKAQSLPALKKGSTLVDLPDGLGGGVKMDRTYHIENDPDTEVPAEERVKAHAYGQDKVPFRAVDEDVLKYQPRKGLRLMGFTPAAQIKRHHRVANTDIIVPEPGCERAEVALSALVQSLLETGRVAIARFVKREKGTPRLVSLSPYRTDALEGLLCDALPFAEDMRAYPFPPLEAPDEGAPGPTDAQLAAAEAVVDAFDITADKLGASRASTLLTPEHTFNPVLQRFYHCLRARIADPQCLLPDPTPQIDGMLKPEPLLLAEARPACAALKSFQMAFTFKTPKTKQNAKRRFWGDTDGDGGLAGGAAAAGESKQSKQDNGGAVAASAGDAAKRPRTEPGSDDAAVSVDDLFGRQVEQVGAAQPASDFESMLRQASKGGSATSSGAALVNRAMTGIATQIRKLATGHRMFHSKAVEALKAMRQGAVAHGPRGYNALLLELKQTHADSDFWDYMIEDGNLTLVSTAEHPAGADTKEAASFLGGASSATRPAAPADTGDDDDDDEFD